MLNHVELYGSGDAPTSGLEAVALAIASDWTTVAHKRRQIIVVWTDTSSYPLFKAPESSGDDQSNLPATLDQLTDLWGRPINSNVKERQAPHPLCARCGPLDLSRQYLENAIHYASKAGDGLPEGTYSAIIDTLANSI